MPRTISLTRELWIVLRSLAGLRRLADLAFDLRDDARAAAEVTSAISATAAIVESRLLFLDRAVTGSIDPALLWSSVNDAGPPADGDEPDVLLRQWSAKHAVKTAKAELRRARAFLAHERQRRKERRS